MSKSNINCYGEEKRRRLVCDYEITILRRFYLLPGQTLQGCCRAIKDLAYEFSFKNRRTKKIGTVYCGHGAGDDFLQLVNQPVPPIFNWKSCRANGEAGWGGKTDGDKPVHPLNQEMLDALHLFFSVKNLAVDIEQPTGELFQKINKNLDVPILPSEVRSINTIFRKYKTTTGRLLQDYRSLTNGHNAKTFHFARIHQLLMDAEVNPVCIGGA